MSKDQEKTECVCKCHSLKKMSGEFNESCCTNCFLSPTQEPEEWEKEFDEKFVCKTCPDTTLHFDGADKVEKVKSFISQEKQKTREEINEKWLELNLQNDNKENWDKELTKFSLYMQSLSLTNLKEE